MLSRIVSEFDALAVRHGVEKIKTIGDAYMVVAGLPEPVPDHTARLARMALDMLALPGADARRRAGSIINLRVGMASGPVTAGVIGTKKFSYDVWGDPVNLASRLEGLVVARPHPRLPGLPRQARRGISSSRRAGRSRSRASARRRRGICSARARRRPAKTGATRRLHRRTSLEPEPLLDAANSWSRTSR